MTWSNKYHANSSLPKKDSQFSLFIGRWQPLHLGHKQLFGQVLDSGGKVCIAIRDMQPDDKNPYTVTEVYANIVEEYKHFIQDGRVKVIKIPDIDSVNFGRSVGYDVIEWIPPADISEISATKIRNNDRTT